MTVSSPLERTARRPSRDPIVVLALLTVAAFAIRIATANVQSYWFDEALTVHLLRLPFVQMIRRVGDIELTPPLYYIVAWLWARVVGSSELALRSLSAVLGAATVPAAYLVGRALAGRRLATSIGALTATSALLVWYSQEARPYALLVLLATLSLLLCLRADRLDRYTAWAFVAMLALLTHYFAAFLVVPEGVWLVLRARRRPQPLVALAAVGAVGGALIPLAANQHRHVSSGYLTAYALPHRIGWVAADQVAGFVVRFDTPVELALTAIGACFAASGVWLVADCAGRERRAATLAAGAATCAIAVPCMVAALGVDYVNTRNLLAGTVPALLVLAAGYAARAAPRRVAALGLGGMCMTGLAVSAIVTLDPHHHRDDWRGAVHAIGLAHGPRLIAAPPFEGSLVLSIYLRDLRPLSRAGATVAEVDVLSPRNTLLGARREPPPGPPPPGFQAAAARVTETYVVARYRAHGPLPVTPDAVRRAAAPLVPSADVVLER